MQKACPRALLHIVGWVLRSAYVGKQIVATHEETEVLSHPVEMDLHFCPSVPVTPTYRQLQFSSL